MRFTPKSEEEAANIWPKGEYDAYVEGAVEKVSRSSGNDMIELSVKVYGEAGKEMTLRDWLVNTDGGQAKLQRFCKAAGLWETYQLGELTADSCKQVNLIVRLGVETSDEYPPRNKIADYLQFKPPGTPAERTEGELAGVPASQTRAAGTGRAEPTKPPTSDEIPF